MHVAVWTWGQLDVKKKIYILYIINYSIKIYVAKCTAGLFIYLLNYKTINIMFILL